MKTKILEEISEKGFKISLRVLEDVFDEFSEKENAALNLLREYTTDLNPGSPKKVAAYFFDTKKAEKVNNRSTDERVLKYLSKNGHPEAIHVLNARKAKRVLSQINGLLNKDLTIFNSDEEFIQIHPGFVPDSVTGRLYLKEPNILGYSRHIRKAIVPEEGCVFINFDYDQQEFLIAAKVSGQKEVIDLVGQGIDVFQMVADEFEIGRDEVKTTFYAKMYRQQPRQLAIILNCTEDRARYYHKIFDQKFPKISMYLNSRERDLPREKVAKTKLAGRQYVLDMTAVDFKKEVRRAMSFEIQGTGADIMDLLLNDNSLSTLMEASSSRIVVPVWDALLIQCPEEIADEVENEVKEIMTKLPLSAGFPQFVSTKRGKSWFEVK